jgi:hypothetical protein
MSDMKRRLGWVAATVCIGTAALLSLPATATFAAPSQATVSYLGRNFTVPASWPVVDLAAHPGTCVRFDRHALYLGTPSPDQDCPSHIVGRTEAVLVAPVAGSGASTTTENTISHEVKASAAGVRVTATYDSDPTLVRGILTAAGFTGANGSSGSPRAARPAVNPAAISTSATTYTGKGFDACEAPSASTMNAWLASPYKAIGIYIGGAQRGCADQPNLTADWVSAQAQAGWHFIPLYVGPQASVAGQITSPTSQGTSAADDAANQAAALGFGAGNPIYYDMEGYGSSQSTIALAFESAWTAELHNRGYLSGYYSSSSSGIADLVANYSNYNMPDIIHIANWNGVASTDDPAVPSDRWANHQRVHQYTGPGKETYGGVQIDIDHDYLDVVSGSTPLSGGAYTPLGPVRVLDTRAAIGVPGTTAVQSGQTVRLQVAGVGGVPASGVTAVALNVTVAEPSSFGFLTVYPDGQGRPSASNLNWAAGQTVPNLVTVQVANGNVDFYNGSAGTVHIVADLAGYFSHDATASSYTPVTPARMLDTRAAIGVPGTTAVQSGQTLTLQVAGAGGVPASGVTAVVLNVTVTEPSSFGFLTVYPDGQGRPFASNLNWAAGQTVPNLVIVPVVNGKVDFYNGSTGTVHVIADLAGYFIK